MNPEVFAMLPDPEWTLGRRTTRMLRRRRLDQAPSRTACAEGVRVLTKKSRRHPANRVGWSFQCRLGRLCSSPRFFWSHLRLQLILASAPNTVYPLTIPSVIRRALQQLGYEAPVDLLNDMESIYWDALSGTGPRVQAPGCGGEELF